MSTLDLTAAEVVARTRALLEAEPSPDLSEPNACALSLEHAAEALQAQLHGPAARDPARAADLCDALAELSGLGDRLRDHVVAMRFATLERIHHGLARLRALPTVAELLPQAAEELARCCDFDRTVVSRVRGSSWRAEALWIRPGHDPGVARDIDEYVTGNWIALDAGVLEADLVRRRVAVLVTARDNRADDNLMAIACSSAYVAAPVLAGGRVAGFLQADCYTSGRELTSTDRDHVASFADGFGLVFERIALLERLAGQRARLHDAFGLAERHLSGVGDAETMLIRRDRESVAVVRTAAGLRKSATSPLDQMLTSREREVVDLMVTGARNSQIGDQLVIAEETVKSHVRSISRKLRASSRADVVSRYLHLRMREGV